MQLRKRCDCKNKQRCKDPWFARFKVRGYRWDLSTGEGDRAAAVVQGSRLQLEKRQAAGVGPGAKCQLSKCAAAHIAEKAGERVSEARVKAVEHHWSPVLRHFRNDFDPSKLTFEALAEYRDKRLGTVRGQTIERELWMLKEGLRIAKRRGWINHYPLPFDEWPVVGHDPKDKSRAGKMHPPEVLRAVLAECDQDMLDRLEFDAITGLRKQELLRLRYDWVEKAQDGSGCAAWLRMPPEGTKDQDARLIPIGARAVAILEARHARAKKRKPLVFPGDRKKALYRFMEKAREKAVEAFGGGKLGRSIAEARGYFVHVTLRDMRATFLTAGEFITKDKKAAADIAGHDRLSTTDIYLHSDLPRLIAFANAASGWLDAVKGGAGSGVRDGGYFGGDMQSQQYFQSARRLVGTTGIEPVTPTVSSGGSKLFHSARPVTKRHERHDKSRSYTSEGVRKGGARKRTGGAR